MSGATCLIIYAVLFSILSGLVKFLTKIPPHEIVFIRSVVTSIATYALLRKVGIPPFGKNRLLLAARGLCGVIYVVLFYGAIQSLPFASAVALHYTFPVMALVLAGIFLKEYPTVKQWICFFFALVGVVMVRGFDTRVNAAGVAMALLSAVAVACVVTLIRKLRNQDHPLVIMLYFPMAGLVLIGPYTVTHWVQPNAVEWGFLVATGVLTQVVQYFLTLAYSRDSAANIGNLNYLTIVFSFLIGWVFFGEIAQPLGIIGMLVILAAAILASKFGRPAAAQATAAVPAGNESKV